ncbi:MAG: hypothetical protein IPP47_22865 [Bryobacterales bacterium]|nr:hypothetical protein [Bryobacterales bacterium]
MTRTQLIRFDHLLGAKRAELLRSLHELRGRLVADRHGDAMDRSRRAADRAIVLQGIDLESELLRRVEGAIQRFGIGRLAYAPTVTA